MQQQQQQYHQHLGSEESPGGNSDGRLSLLIRHLPETIPEESLFRLLSHYGASSVRSCAATGRLRFLGKVLKVERAATNNDKPSQASNKDSTSVNTPSKPSLVHNATTKRKGEEIEGSRSEPIAPRFGVDHPLPPQLEYAYPPPDGNILTNIVNALIAVPRFYTQVLHLMNKMDIPAPFRLALPSPPLPPSVPVPLPPPPPLLAEKPRSTDLSSEESEMESSDEEVKDKSYSRASSGQKRLKQEAIVGPAVDKDVAHEDVGLKLATLIPKEIPMIKKKNPIVQIKIAPKVVTNENKDDDITEDSEHPENESADINAFATPAELEKGKLPPEEILSLPMFNNYAAGNPALVLYIKNLAKDIVADDFYYIFGSLFGSTDAAKSGLSVKLMQEGRMRGQAFVTFPSVELAHCALNLVNGYVFKGKPMIIQFGWNPVAGKAK